MEVIRIRSAKSGFRRCGIAHSSEWTEHPAGAFTPGQLQQLEAEPMLMVEIVERPDAQGLDLEPQVDDEPEPEPEPCTIAELEEWLQAHAIAIPSGAKKADLVALYQSNKDKQPEGGSE